MENNRKLFAVLIFSAHGICILYIHGVFCNLMEWIAPVTFRQLRVGTSLGHAVCCCLWLSWWPCKWFADILLLISDQHVVPDYFNTYHQNALTSKTIPFSLALRLEPLNLDNKIRYWKSLIITLFNHCCGLYQYFSIEFVFWSIYL